MEEVCPGGVNLFKSRRKGIGVHLGITAEKFVYHLLFVDGQITALLTGYH